MNHKELVDAVATRLGTSKAEVGRVLAAMTEVVHEKVTAGEDVTVRGVGRFALRRSPARTIRSVNDMRKILVGPRHGVRFAPAASLRAAASLRDDPTWSDPAVQGAWRTAETLVGDLDLYHKAKAPSALNADHDDAAVMQACSAAFGGLWRQVEETFTERVPAELRGRKDLLAAAARRRWSIGA